MEETHIATGNPAESKEWQETKQSLPLDFPNVPYLYDGDVKISQSVAILRYLGRKFFLDGMDDAEKTRIDLIEQQILDWRNQGVNVFYDKNKTDDFEKLCEDYRKTLPDKMLALSKFLGDRKFLAGGTKASYVDFLAYEYLDVQEQFSPGLFDNTPNIKEYVERIRNLPNVKAYMTSDRFKEMPIYNLHAKWGNKIIPRSN